MNNAPQVEPSFAVQSLLAYLEKEYYTPVTALCAEITDCITEIHGGDREQSASLYTTLCRKLIDHVERYVRLRRVSLLPYLHELVEKEEDGHDCRICSSSCTVRHSMQLSDVQDAHGQIRDTLDKLRGIEETAVCQLIHGELEKTLHRKVKVLDDMLSELLYLEETALIPKIMEAQKAIHAHA